MGAATNWFEKRIKDLDLTELGRVRPDSGDVTENIFIWNDQNSPKSARYKKKVRSLQVRSLAVIRYVVKIAGKQFNLEKIKIKNKKII